MKQSAETSAQTPPLPSGARSIPAWALSCGFHAVLLLVLVWFLQPNTPQVKGIEGDRSVSIVLAKTSDQQTEYFTDETQDAKQQAAAQNAEALPPQKKAPESQLLPDLQLPGARDSAVSSESVELPDLSATGQRPSILPGQGTAEILAQDAKDRRRGPTGAATDVSVFGSAPASGRTFVFVIDRSKSMGGEGLGALAAAGKELTRGLRTLKSHHRFQIIAYHQTCTYFEGTALLTADPARIGKVDGWLRKLAAFGSTEHTNGLVSAIRMKPDVIFFLTDGGVPELDSNDLRRIRRYTGGKISIHSIHFGSGPLQEDDNFLKQLSRQNAGSYRYVDMRTWKVK